MSAARPRPTVFWSRKLPAKAGKGAPHEARNPPPGSYRIGGCGPFRDVGGRLRNERVRSSPGGAKDRDERDPQGGGGRVVRRGGPPPPLAPYSPAGKRDPFVPFLRVEQKIASADLGSLPPLQRYELAELRFVGVIWGPNVTRALVEDSEGKGYTVTVGTKVGRAGGTVTRITDGEIFVREEFQDYSGTKAARESSLKLQTGGGK